MPIKRIYNKGFSYGQTISTFYEDHEKRSDGGDNTWKTDAEQFPTINPEDLRTVDTEARAIILTYQGYNSGAGQTGQIRIKLDGEVLVTIDYADDSDNYDMVYTYPLKDTNRSYDFVVEYKQDGNNFEQMGKKIEIRSVVLER